MYPSDSLTVITPIVFFILLLGFPVIGVFAGWKRAAYWGGGNLLFYIIGLIIWKCGSSDISNTFSNLLISILGDKIKDLDFSILLNSVITPLFFVIVMLVGNLILVICYYAFVKRLLHIGKYAKNKDKGPTGSVQVQTTKQSVVDKKWFNRVVGGVGFGILMLPITLSTTHLVTIATTDTSTRKTNSFTKGMYEGLQSLSNSMNWFSYYNGDVTGRDYDGLFNIIDMYSVTITYKDCFDKQQTSNSVKALSDLLNQGFNNLINKTLDPSITTQTIEAIQPIVTSVNNLVKSWDSITSQCKGYVEVILNSPGITKLLDGLIATAKASIPISNDQVKDRINDVKSIFNVIEQAYIQGKLVIQGVEIVFEHVKNTIDVPQDAFNILTDTIYSLYDVSQLTEENKQILKDKTIEQLQLLFNIDK